MGRRSAKSTQTKITEFVNNKEKERLDVSHGKAITVLGVLSIFFGALSLAGGCFLGVWAEKNPRKLKKSS